MNFLERIDPEMRAGLVVYDMLGLSQHQKLEGDTIQAIRAQSDAAVLELSASYPPNERVSREDRTITGSGGELAIRIFRPAKRTDALLPAVVWLHGGGMMFGSLEIDVPFAERYVEEIDCVVILVNYRLAPENPYPAGLEDCYATLVWCAENAAEMDIDPARIAVGGESAGGGLAAGTALLARDRKGPALAYQILVYPMLDDRNNTPSAFEFEEIPSWSRQQNHWGWRGLLGERSGGDDVATYAAPARETNFENLPPALVQVGELDIFRDECIDYAARLMRAKVSAELHVYPAAFHGWDACAPESRQSARAFDERIEAMRRALHPRLAAG